MSLLTKLSKMVGLDYSQIVAVAAGGGGLHVYELDVDPYEFLLLAEKEWIQGGHAAGLNAIANAKRAITAQMDQALFSFGYPATTWNILGKIEILNSLNLVPPRILRRVSSILNLFEHEYCHPSDSDIQDAIDLAALFVASMKPSLAVFCDGFLLGNRDERVDAFGFKGALSFSMMGAKSPPCFLIRARRDEKIFGEVSVDWRYPEFSKIVRLAVATDRGFKLDEALAEFCGLLENDV